MPLLHFTFQSAEALKLKLGREHWTITCECTLDHWEAPWGLYELLNHNHIPMLSGSLTVLPTFVAENSPLSRATEYARRCRDWGYGDAAFV